MTQLIFGMSAPSVKVAELFQDDRSASVILGQKRRTMVHKNWVSPISKFLTNDSRPAAGVLECAYLVSITTPRNVRVSFPTYETLAGNTGVVCDAVQTHGNQSRQLLFGETKPPRKRR